MIDPSRFNHLRVDVAETIGAVWARVPALDLGDTAASTLAPREHVLVRDGERPVLRLDVRPPRDDYHLATRAALWREWVVVGYGARVELVSLRDGRRRLIDLRDEDAPASFDYFCQIESNAAALLVTSGRRVFRLGEDGAPLWVSGEVGLDGVIVALHDGDVVCGSGEWDPPDGWKSFRLSLATGRTIGGEDTC